MHREIAAAPMHRRLPILAALAVAIASFAGFLLSRNVSAAAIGSPEPGLLNVFYYLFGANEQPFFVIAGLAASLTIMLFWLAPSAEPHRDIRTIRVSPALVATAAMIITWAGSRVVLHDFPLSMDEYNAVFQAEIFASGNIAAPVPHRWSEIIGAIKPEYVTYKADQGVWLSSYLPVYAAIRAPFARFGIDGIVNPLFAAAAIVCLAVIGRRIWPEESARVSLAVLLLLSSSQFLLTSMSWYAMPAHLALNLVWLVSYLRGGRLDFLALMLVGFLALGLHNPFPHALFVAPFILRLLRSRKYARFAMLGASYVIGAVVWWSWLQYSLSPDQSGAVADVFGIPSPHDILTQAMSLSLIVSWQSPLFALGLFLGLARWGSLTSVERDLASGFLLTCLFFVFFKASQGHGWGYRYVYGVFGNAALLATIGVCSFARHLRPNVFKVSVACSCVIAFAIQLPLRSMQAYTFVKPWADASVYLSTFPSEVVAIPARAIWYGYDLARARPFLSDPQSVVLRTTSRTVLGRLERAGTRVTVIPCSDLIDLGLRGNCEAEQWGARGSR